MAREHDHHPNWKYDGVRVVHWNEPGINTAQTLRMHRAAR